MNTQMTPWPPLASCGNTLTFPGGGLFYYDYKSPNFDPQKPALVFIHGLGDEADTWRHILPLLGEQGYRCIAPDLPGFGRSVWRGKITVKGHAEAVIRLMAECGLGAQQPVVLIGSSMGSGIAESTAFMVPEMIRALILLDGCFPIPGSIGKGMFMLLLPGVGRRWYRSFRKNHNAAWKSLYAYYHDLDAMSGEDRQFLRERVIARVESENQERGYLSSLKSMIALFMFKKRSFALRIKQFKGNILLLWGEHDHIMPAAKNSIVRALRPDAVFGIVAGAGHLPQQEKPPETAEIILRFLAERL
jgi:pimeloyl-ACP methyl ester carboxylesterase